jgi:hypothetical protein
MKTALGVYLAGLVVGLVATDGRPGARLVLALLWPLGPLAFVVTVAGLLAASTIAFPVVGAALVAMAGLGWWLMNR